MGRQCLGARSVTRERGYQVPIIKVLASPVPVVFYAVRAKHMGYPVLVCVCSVVPRVGEMRLARVPAGGRLYFAGSPSGVRGTEQLVSTWLTAS